jgi:hypothetical protein
MTVTHEHPHAHQHDHGAGHWHDQSDDHSHPAEAAPGASKGAVVLDIGGEIGAAVVLTPPSMDGLEIEIRPAGTEWDGTHVAVRERVQPGRPSLHAAVFGALSSGTYDLRVRFGGAGSVVHHVEVIGGQVTTTQWLDVL